MALKHQTLFTIPKIAITTVIDDMGKEILLSGARVEPQKLMASGYKFRNLDLESVLGHSLGL